MKAVALAAMLAVWGPLELAAQTIDTVIVVTHNIFDARDGAPGPVARLANALHVTTRPGVVRRTILLAAGQPYDSARVVESERLLRGLTVFRDIRIDTMRVDGRFALRVETSDGWSTRIDAGYSSTGGSVSWSAGAAEQNFLGTATLLAAHYERTPDRSAVDLQYQNPAFLFRRAALATEYKDLSDGQRGIWSYGVPFYETSAPLSLLTTGEAANQRVLLYRQDTLVQTTERRALVFGITAGRALFATERDYLRVSAGAQLRREDFAPKTTTPFPRSVTGAVGLQAMLGHVRYSQVQHVNSFLRREDVDLSQTLAVGLWAAPRAWGYGPGHAGVTPIAQGQGSVVWRGGYALVRAEAHGMFVRSGLDSAQLTGAINAVSQNIPGQTLVFHLEGGNRRNATPGTEFDLWRDGIGPRLFGAHEFTGTRMSWFAAEDRILVTDELWGLLGVGVAPFVDWGGAWFKGDPRRLGGDAGVALRLGPTRSIRGDVAEVAFGYRWGAGFTGKRLALTVRTGFAYK
jgi:hypothetical protein